MNNPEQLWLRWWDLEGNLLLTGHEQAQQERQKRQQLVQRLKSLTPEQLQALGIDTEMLD